MLKKFFAAVVLIGVCEQASADGYYGLNYSRVRLSDAEPTSLALKLGYQVEDSFSVEARAGFPVQKDSSRFSGIDVDFEAKYMGAFGRYGVFRQRGGVYGLVGFMDLTIEVSAAGEKQEDSKSDLVFGMGAEFGEDGGFNVEYLSGMRDLEEISWLNLGYFHKF